jgi:simple sugar transport system permease protein
MSTLQATIAATVTGGTPLLLAALGELIEERVGLLNIGLDGLMLVGAAVGFAVAVKSSSIDLALLAGAGAGVLFSLIFSIPSIRLRTDQILPGFALWLIGLGLSSAYGAGYVGQPLFVTAHTLAIPLLDRIPDVGQPLFNNTWPVYFAVLASVAAAVVLARTRVGLGMRAVGDDPVAADVAGVRVQRIRYACSLTTGALAGFGGAFLAVEVVGRWQDGLTAGRGFMALALVIFARWNPLLLVLSAYAFGLLLYLADLGQSLDWPIRPEFLDMAPYVATFIVLVLGALAQRRRPGSNPAPAALGRIFVRGRA